MALSCKSQERERSKTLTRIVLSMLPLVLLLVNVYGCDVAEREALLDVKGAITDDPVGRLNSWKGANCCAWHGIYCDPKRGGGFVTKLDLRSEEHQSNYSTVGTLSPSLARLGHLRYLDLSGVYFTGVEPIPPFIGSLQSLVYLNLSRSGFNGMVPPQLGNLSSLTHLDLSKLSEGSLTFRDFSWLSGLSSLQILNLQCNQILQKGKQGEEKEGVSTHLFLELNKLPSISELHLFSCGLKSLPPSLPHVNFTSLTHLDLSSNFDDSLGIPMWLFNITTLEFLDLSHNSISGMLPEELGKLNKLTGLYLPTNSFTAIPKTIAKLSNLRVLDLRSNKLDGSIPQEIGKLHMLEYLLVSDNNFKGSIPNSICALEKLQILDLAHNGFSRGIPSCWKINSSLKIIDLSSNNLEGRIPEAIGSLPSLARLHLDGNKLHGRIPSSLNFCTKLQVLDLGDNKLSGKIPRSFQAGNLSELEVLRLRSNRLSGNIPPHLFTFRKLHVIDISHNNLTGGIPRKFTNSLMTDYPPYDPEKRNSFYCTENISLVQKGREYSYYSQLLLFVTIDLSANRLSGFIPVEIVELAGLQGLNFSNNHLTGKIPETIDHLNRIESLDFSNNHLTGKIPETIDHLNGLKFLDLSSNNISGHIPTSIDRLNSLRHLNVSYNNLSGPIPKGTHINTTVYEGNPHLCGYPLKECPPIPPQEEDSSNKRWFESLWFIVGFLLGFIFGFWVFCGTLIVKKKLRYSYFQAIDRILGCFYRKCYTNRNG